MAEIIEAVVKDNGSNAIKKEKLICRLSREEKAFIEKSSVIFKTDPIVDGTVETALTVVASRLQTISERVPLWVLPAYIRMQTEPAAETMGNVINLLCEANTISSKGNTEIRSNKVKGDWQASFGNTRPCRSNG